MNKKTVLAAAIAMFGFAFAAEAQTTATTNTEVATTTTTTATTQDNNKQKIAADKLPEAVQNTIKGDLYKSWQVADAYSIAPAAEGETAMYEVHLKNEKETVVVHLDEKGNVAEKK